MLIHLPNEQYWCIFCTSRVQLLILRPVILTEVFRTSLSLYKKAELLLVTHAGEKVLAACDSHRSIVLIQFTSFSAYVLNRVIYKLFT
jgi:hypothetical protein